MPGSEEREPSEGLVRLDTIKGVAVKAIVAVVGSSISIASASQVSGEIDTTMKIVCMAVSVFFAVCTLMLLLVLFLHDSCGRRVIRVAVHEEVSRLIRNIHAEVPETHYSPLVAGEEVELPTLSMSTGSLRQSSSSSAWSAKE